MCQAEKVTTLSGIVGCVDLGKLVQARSDRKRFHVGYMAEVCLDTTCWPGVWLILLLLISLLFLLLFVVSAMLIARLVLSAAGRNCEV